VFLFLEKPAGVQARRADGIVQGIDPFLPEEPI
jgi:hypothetical protein